MKPITSSGRTAGSDLILGEAALLGGRLEGPSPSKAGDSHRHDLACCPSFEARAKTRS
jgi:hypothetical protein